MASASNRVDLTLTPAAGSRTVSVSLPSPSKGGARVTLVLDLGDRPGPDVPIEVFSENGYLATRRRTSRR